MAILGFQLVSTLIGASILSKIVRYISFAQFILCKNLYRFIHPSTEDLIKAANININNLKKNKKYSPPTDDNNINVSKTVDIDLTKVPVKSKDVVTLYYYSDYQWLIDFTLCCLMVYGANEVVYAFFPATYERMNLSIIWIFLGLGFTLRALFCTNSLYFNMQDTSDAMIILLSSFSFLVVAMVALIIPDHHLDFGFANAYKNLSESIHNQFPQHANKMVNLITIKGILVIISAIIGGMLTHSGLRYGKMYMGSLVDASNLKRVALHVSFILPLFLLCLWLTPVKDKFLTLRIGKHNLTEDDFLSLRLILLFIFFGSRLFLARTHLQAYLNLADIRIQSLRKEAGKISIIDYQKIIIRIFYCLCLVAVQYFSPVLLCLYITCLYKSLSGIRWSGSFGGVDNLRLRSFNKSDDVNLNISSLILPFVGDLNSTIQEWSSTVLELRALFSGLLYQSVIGYLLWFVLVSLQLTSLLGVVYHHSNS